MLSRRCFARSKEKPKANGTMRTLAERRVFHVGGLATKERGYHLGAGAGFEPSRHAKGKPCGFKVGVHARAPKPPSERPTPKTRGPQRAMQKTSAGTLKA